MWVGGILILLSSAILIALVVWAFSFRASSPPGQPPKAPASAARQIIEERLARGEITADEFRELARALDEHRQ